MLKNNSKIYRRSALTLLVIIISGLLNICLFTFQAGTASAPLPTLKINFSSDGGDNCVARPLSEPTLTFNRPTAPMPLCCLTQNRNFKAMVSTANDKSTPTFSSQIVLLSNNLSPENNLTHYTSRLIYPPPEALALASIVIRE